MAKTGYENIPTEKLKFVLGIGEAGLQEWHGKDVSKVKAHIQAMRKELAKRGVNPREFGFNEDPDAHN